MKTLAILFTLFYFLNALAVAPYGIKGQQQSSTIYPNVHQFPNNLVTNMGGINALVETGNKNILTNPSFEHATFSTGWTNSAGTFTADTVVEVDGLKAAKLVLSAQTMSLTQSSTLYASQFADGIQGLASVRIKSDVALSVCSIQAGTVSTTNCVSVQANNKWGFYKVPFILGGTSNGISIASSGSTTGTVYIDDAFVGAVDLQASTNNISPWITFTPTGTWVANTVYTGRYRQVGENYEYQMTATTSGAPTSTSLSFNLPTGHVIDTTKMSSSNALIPNSTAISFDNGLALYSSIVYYNTTTQVSIAALNAAGTYAVAAGVSQAIPFTFGASDSVAISFSVPIVGLSGASSTYTSTNADTDWASCNPSSSQGFGTPTYALQCKRQGSDLLMKGTFTSGASSGVEARIGLPLWNGVQLNSAGLSIIPSIQAAGLGGRSDGSNALGLLVEPSVSYLTFGQYADGVRPLLTKQNGNIIASLGTIVSFTARIPIEGWQNSNIIIGQFNGLQSCTSTLACTDTFSAYVSAAGVVSNENVDWISGNCSVVSTNQYTCTYVSGLVTQPMNCQAVVSDNVTITSNANMYAGTLTSLAYQTYKNIDSVAIAQPVSLSCQKQGADYVGKTAVAVASDQNVRAIGSTGVDIQSVFFGSSADCTTACTTGTCTICSQVGSKITSVTWQSAGSYRLNGIDGTKYICNGNALIPGTIIGVVLDNRPSSSSTQKTISTYNSSTGLAVNAGYVSITCTGIP